MKLIQNVSIVSLRFKSTILGLINFLLIIHDDIEGVRCSQNEHRCSGTNRCISNEKLCDSNRDCPDGDDELQCDRSLPSNTIDDCDDKNHFVCDNQQECIAIEQRCDRNADCSDGSDEFYCDIIPFNSSTLIRFCVGNESRTNIDCIRNERLVI